MPGTPSTAAFSEGFCPEGCGPLPRETRRCPGCGLTWQAMPGGGVLGTPDGVTVEWGELERATAGILAEIEQTLGVPR